jgi:hypothetical protein
MSTSFEKYTGINPSIKDTPNAIFGQLCASYQKDYPIKEVRYRDFFPVEYTNISKTVYRKLM